ncbi:MAG: hypothetical protein C0467_24640 [Planctomycetaceae bacterium]|nr:hypothetical protein [Planctomycetaceae bacterium]
MSLREQCRGLVVKYGSAAKVVVTSVLNVVAPGCGKLVELAGQAIDSAKGVAEKSAKDEWERDLLESVQNNEAELERLGRLFERLSGPLANLCDKANAFADQPEELPDIIGRALAANPTLSKVLHDLGDIKEEFGFFQSDLQRIADRQEEAIPVYARMNRVADYFDELWQAGIKPKQFVECIQKRDEVARHIEQGQLAGTDALLLDLRTSTPQASSVCILEAAAATRDFNYPLAQRALISATKLRPSDAGLAELSRRVTVLATAAIQRTPTPNPSSEPNAPKRLQPGDMLDGWKLESRLGAGSWGQVFRAVQNGQPRALKVMHPNFAADRAFVDRFKKEIATLHRLPRHPNLVRIEDFGFCADWRTWYLTMEYIDGPTLEQYLAKNGPMTEEQIRTMFAEAVRGLAEAHTARIIHRDIKPGNLVFRRSDKRLVFVDFGLAVGVEDFGQTGIGGRTIQFAAPEQHYGESATQASDVFSLCAVIHYAAQYDKPELRKPNRFTPKSAPESLREMLTRGMVSNVEDRFQHAGQLLNCFALRWPDVEADYEAFLKLQRRGNGMQFWLEQHAERLPRWQATAAQNSAAMLLVGHCHDEGIGLRQDHAEAMKWFLKAADAGNAVAMMQLGVRYDHGRWVPQDYAEAMKWYRRAADAGNAGAMCNIGVLVNEGQGVPQDYAEAMKWYRKAADAGDTGAMRNIGMLYDNAEGVPQDHIEAMKWYRKAADAGDIYAMRNIGLLYDIGGGVPQDHIEAMKWYRKAADTGNEEAMYSIGVLYHNGQGVPQDYAEALKWYRKAAEAGDTGAMMRVGVLYHNGQGVPQDFTETMKWYRKAADTGDADAMYSIGMLYDNAEGVPQDRIEALKWYRKAADAGNAGAMYNIGTMYHTGEGVPQDHIEALKWYRKAADAGHAMTAEYVAALEKRSELTSPDDDEFELTQDDS